MHKQFLPARKKAMADEAGGIKLDDINA